MNVFSWSTLCVLCVTAHCPTGTRNLWPQLLNNWRLRESSDRRKCVLSCTQPMFHCLLFPFIHAWIVPLHVYFTYKPHSLPALCVSFNRTCVSFLLPVPLSLCLITGSETAAGQAGVASPCGEGGVSLGCMPSYKYPTTLHSQCYIEVSIIQFLVRLLAGGFSVCVCVWSIFPDCLILTSHQPTGPHRPSDMSRCGTSTGCCRTRPGGTSERTVALSRPSAIIRGISTYLHSKSISCP